MLFNSYPFIFGFLPIALLVFFLAGKKSPRLAIAWLVIASLFFYGYWDPQYLWVISTTMIFNYYAALALSSPSWQLSTKKLILTASLTANLARLGYFKYANFIIDNINTISGSQFHLDPIVLPLGISFFTFVEIAYLIDAYYGKVGNYNFLDYCLFITFFPHLLAGPIVHHNEMLPQFANPRVYRFNPRGMVIGLTVFSIGLFKKVVLADSIAIHANAVFNSAALGIHLTFMEAWGGALAYTFQLYFDFSGYSDMAIGLGLMFGIRWPLNFYSPYKSVNIIEFWRRWHMTLSRFLRDYLYVALGGNRKGNVRRYINLMATMLLGGLWHGAGWTFVIWGGLHGLYLVMNHAWRALRQHLGYTQSFMVTRELSRLLTFVAVVIGWVFFRASDVSTAMSILTSMTGLDSIAQAGTAASTLGYAASELVQREATNTLQLSPLVFGDPVSGWSLIIGLFLIARCFPNTHEFMRRVRTTCDDYQDASVHTPAWLLWKPTHGWAIALAAMFLFSVFQLAENSEFLYFQF